MKPWSHAFLAAAALAGLAGCLKKEELTARATGPISAPDCAACHAYPIKDTNHVVHLFDNFVDKKVNGPVTCLDCHATSIARRPHVVLDSIYRDSDGNEWSTADFPIDPKGPTIADTLRTFPFLRVDTLAQERPIPVAPRPGAKPLWEEYVTSLAHMNGKVDVEFHPRVTDAARFEGRKAEFMPAKETCSAVACHPNDNPYWRFADSAKGLRELSGQPGDLP